MDNPHKRYYSIAEVSEMLDISLSNLRFWEKEFPQLKPKQSERKTRFYTAEDIQLLKQIIFLTKEKEFTLAGARRQLAVKKSETEREQEVFERLTELRKELKLLIANLKD